MWVLEAVWGTLYQLVITPIRWADDTAGRMAKDVERRMEHEAEAGSMCEIPMRRLREAGEDARPLYQVAAGSSEERSQGLLPGDWRPTRAMESNQDSGSQPQLDP